MAAHCTGHCKYLALLDWTAAEIKQRNDRIEELEADNARLRDLLSDIDAVTIWEAGGTVPDRSMQDRIDAALDVMGKENSTVSATLTKRVW